MGDPKGTEKERKNILGKAEHPTTEKGSSSHHRKRSFPRVKGVQKSIVYDEQRKMGRWKSIRQQERVRERRKRGSLREEKNRRGHASLKTLGRGERKTKGRIHEKKDIERING